jgi:hypothetical protein
MDDKTKATNAQVKYATDLLNKLGYDLDWYDLEKMSRDQISKLIDELKNEWEG